MVIYGKKDARCNGCTPPTLVNRYFQAGTPGEKRLLKSEKLLSPGKQLKHQRADSAKTFGGEGGRLSRAILYS